MDTAALSRWISEYATAADDWDVLLGGVCSRLVELGLPLWRAGIGSPTINPDSPDCVVQWYADQGTLRVSNTHGPEQVAAHLRSPIFALLQRGEVSGRWRLDALQEGDHFPILLELRDQGGVDYLLHIIHFAPGTALQGAAISFTTRRATGFADNEIAAIEALRPALGLAVAKLNLSQTLREVLSVYVGRMTGRRVLEGQIRRGQGQKVAAAILLADLRSFTALSDHADPTDVVGWLNEHFDALGEPVTRHGGEILKFLGDGFLAIFPVPDATTVPCQICGRALDAALDALRANAALNLQRSGKGLPELEADIVLHFGEVVYGNVGASRRLDFTVIGRAVNEASRIESYCEKLGRPLLTSASFATRCDRPLEIVGAVSLRGLANPQRVWSAPGV
ncbi:MAG: adenylate/guanylate cyclase domain-containing protein [Burkholderiaceae bacterium]